MDLVPLEPDDIDEKTLSEAMFAHHLLGQSLPAFGERQATALPFYVPVLAQPVQHFGDRRGGSSQSLGDAGLSHRHALFRQREHRLEVLLDRRGVLLWL